VKCNICKINSGSQQKASGTPLHWSIVLSSILISHVFGVIWFFCHPCPMSSCCTLHERIKDLGSCEVSFLAAHDGAAPSKRKTAEGASRHLDRSRKKHHFQVTTSIQQDLDW
jgi:hypothetical protein